MKHSAQFENEVGHRVSLSSYQQIHVLQECQDTKLMQATEGVLILSQSFGVGTGRMCFEHWTGALYVQARFGMLNILFPECPIILYNQALQLVIG